MELYRYGANERVNSTAAKKSVNFPLAYAIEAVIQYSKSLDICSFIIDDGGDVLFSTNNNSEICSFCSAVRELLGNRLNCKNSHLYGAYQAERYDGSYTFFCPIGLVLWSSPIIIEGILQGAVIGGPVLVESPEEIVNNITQKSELTPVQTNMLLNRINRIKRVQQGKLESYAYMLSLVTDKISKTSGSTGTPLQTRPNREPNVSDYIYHLRTMGGDDGEAAHSYPLEKERELLRHIAGGDKQKARGLLNEILGHVFFSSGNNVDVVKARVLELVVLLSRAALEGGADVEEIFGLNFHYINKIQQFKTIDQLATWLAKIMNRFSDLVFNLTDVKHVDVIFKALEYIKKNYMNKLSLQDVAEAAHISPSYFSKVFKDEMNCNFNNYLNRYRVEVAKKLLLDISIPLVNVAFLTGFEDQSYFSKVFKKIAGMSPGKYREAMGRVNQEKTG